MISDDRQHGTSAIYFSRPISRLDYTAMKYLSVAVILGFVSSSPTSHTTPVPSCSSQRVGHTSRILSDLPWRDASWNNPSDNIHLDWIGPLQHQPESLLRSNRIPEYYLRYQTGLLLVELQFETTFMYALSPYDCLAHLGQFLLGIPSNYEHPVSISAVSILAMNSLAVWLLVSRVTSLEVTRE